MTDTAQQGLSPDLIPFISQPEVSMAVVEVTGTRWTRKVEDDDLEVDSGPVRFRVLSAIHGTMRDGQSLEVPAKRVVDRSARARHAFDAWNTLTLISGERLILAARPGASPAAWYGVAGRAVFGPDAPDVQSVRRAYVIEEARGDVRAKAGMLNGALQSGQELLMFYGIDYLRRHASEREDAARVLASAATVAAPSEAKLEMGRALADSEFFEPAAEADRVNSMVVSALANALVQETDGERRVSWAQAIGSCVLLDFKDDEAGNAKVRHELTRAPGAPTASRVVAAISAAESAAEPDARPNLEQLKRVWQTP